MRKFSTLNSAVKWLWWKNGICCARFRSTLLYHGPASRPFGMILPWYFLRAVFKTRFCKPAKVA